MQGERDWGRHILPGSALPIICTHREALGGSWLSLEVPLWVTARQEKTSEELLCMAFKDSRLNQTRIIIPWDSLLSESRHTPLFSEAGGLCLHQPAIFKQISLYVYKRWIQVSQSCCCGCTWGYSAELPQDQQETKSYLTWQLDWLFGIHCVNK